MFADSGTASVLEACTSRDLDPLWHLSNALDTTVALLVKLQRQQIAGGQDVPFVAEHGLQAEFQ